MGSQTGFRAVKHTFLTRVGCRAPRPGFIVGALGRSYLLKSRRRHLNNYETLCCLVVDQFYLSKGNFCTKKPQICSRGNLKLLVDAFLQIRKVQNGPPQHTATWAYIP